ncbi:neuraminidase-like domain-containing protein [Symbiopectobacterium purcellii]|uniref:Tc toxin subunit A-related protein n=1 Tax=Symbiopectobacterium purcellii TaxID=2871826 RepID=UPI003F8573C5
MYLIDEILGKLNASRNNYSPNEQITLPHIMIRSFSEVKALAGDALSWGEKNFLYQLAQKELQENKMAESRILSRANPQLESAVRLGIQQSPMLGGYDDLFPARSSSFVKTGSVASMFSPAAYLTELYREARDLHPETSHYHLDNRRPDLASLSLSQTNMDDELSTLSLSNELLLNNIQKQEDKDYDAVMNMLATYRQTSDTPYNQSYEMVRQCITMQDPEFASFRNNPTVSSEMDTAALLSIQGDISPELQKILTEDITEDNVDDLIKENFGDIPITPFQDITYLSNWYGITFDEMSSLLRILRPFDIIMPGVEYYQDDHLISLLESDGQLNALLMTRKNGDNTNNLNYAELLPLGGGQFQFNYNFSHALSYTDFSIGTESFLSDDLLATEKFIPKINTPYSITFSLSEAQLSNPVEIGISRTTNSSGAYSSFIFQQTTYPFNFFLLKLNKLIRLYKAIGIDPSDIRNIVESSNSNFNLTPDVLRQLFQVHYNMQRYGIGVSASIVLSGAAIGQTAHSNQASAFTRLFNTPMLNGTEFFANGVTITLDPDDPDEFTDTFHTGVIKRAFGVNDTELYTLWKLVSGDTSPSVFTCTIENLSALYRVSLLADIHALSVTELAMLLSVSPYASTPVGSLSGEALSPLVGFIDRHMQWLKVINWTVSDLYLMLTDRFSTTFSPDIQNLITTLKNGLASQDLSNDSEADLITAAAPFIAAATQLESAETAAAVLQWLSQLQPQTLTVSAFLTLLDKDTQTDALVSYCQVMGQLVLIVRNTGMSSAELSWVVAHPSIITEKATVLNHDIGTLYDLTQLHALLSLCGTSASEILTSLSGNFGSEENNLAVRTVAAALNLDEQALTQALAQCSSYTYFYSWIQLRDALQWLDVATTFHISPANVAMLVKLTHTSPDADWDAASYALQAGLNTNQTAQLSATLDEAISAAASGYVIKNIAPSWVISRDKLYSWLLIDNQVSAQIKTTRIAEAITSVQLYINRALSLQEEDVVFEVKSKTFFASDWDTYNKSYSTWAGVSQLAYYPENYIDPTLRIGQTGMMDEMLQTLSQSQLTDDIVEDAFKTYMTRFEEVSNLDVISGYHDGVNKSSGKTYLIGKSAIGEYYWRSAVIDEMSDGKLPANAWSEWKKITVGLSPINSMVRPVIFQSRLYLTWVEGRVKLITGDSTPQEYTECQLKYTHILHDGTWSAPITIELDSTNLPTSSTDIAGYSMYSAKDVEQEKLYVFFYKKEDDYSNLPSGTSGLIISIDGQIEIASADLVAKMAGYIYLQMDTTSTLRINTPYTGGKTKVNILDVSEVDHELGYGNYTSLNNVQWENISSSIVGTDANIKFNVSGNIGYNLKSDGRSGTLVNMMNYLWNEGDVFYVPNTKLRSTISQHSGRNFECVINSVTCFIKVLDNIEPALNDTIYCFNYPNTSYLNYYCYGDPYPFKKNVYDRREWTSNNIKADNYVYAFMSEASRVNKTPVELCFGDFKKIDTTIDLNSIILSVSGPVSASFTADNYQAYSFERTGFSFLEKNISIPLSAFSNNITRLELKINATAPQGDLRFLGSDTLGITLIRVDENTMPIISINRTDTYAQYLEYGVYRVRVNTLFAKKLISKANRGLNAVLSMDTQELQEPKLGIGFYVDFILPAYNPAVHGESREFSLNLRHVIDDNNIYKIYSGMFTDEYLSVRLFIPLANKDNILHPTYIAKVFLLTNKTTTDADNVGAHFKYTDATDTTVELNPDISDITMFSNVIILNDQTTEPMDFSGANALYFWEMFYYVPMMVFKRLLNESKFTEAMHWIKYVWNPYGYLVNNQPANWVWNVRPLEEETIWKSSQIDSSDPDAVAQADPMHYKVATFMSYLDLLIARGDAAYRQLERDTLKEAKMWYVQAMDILGDEPYMKNATAWNSPRLSDAADKTTKTLTQHSLMMVRQQRASGKLSNSNSLTTLFLPQKNGKLAGYWQTLAQRLYNLRHNLSIDGSPLSLPIYATPADPAALLSAAVISSQDNSDMPDAVMPLYRFPVILESARSMTTQLTQFGRTLLDITERQDAEALSELMQAQGAELILQSIALQNRTIKEIDADKVALEINLRGAQARLESYTTLYDEDISAVEKQVMDLALYASVVSTTASAFQTVAAGLDALPNIYGMAFGGSHYGSISRALGYGIEIAGNVSRITSDRLSQSEIYRRRRQDWAIQRDAAQSEVNQINAQLDTMAVRREAALLQKAYLETQQAQTHVQMTFLKKKFTSKVLYNWLRGKLVSIYYQFYDLTVSRCLMAQKAYQWARDTETSFIRSGAWQSTYAGLMAGETLMLNLAQMEQNYLEKDQREKEVTRTVCLSEVYAGLSSDAFTLADQIVNLVTTGSGSVGAAGNGLSVTSDKQLQATLTLSDLNIGNDYPSSLGNTRRIKQISVTLPTLVGPYQDVRAVLSYGGSVSLPRGCTATAVSNGINDSGQFQMDFNDGRWLPFEGIPVNDSGMLTLSFPEADGSQKGLLLSMTDIILHIRYTIVS